VSLVDFVLEKLKRSLKFGKPFFFNSMPWRHLQRKIEVNDYAWPSRLDRRGPRAEDEKKMKTARTLFSSGAICIFRTSLKTLFYKRIFIFPIKIN
jgi:hypothetical protein